MADEEAAAPAGQKDEAVGEHLMVQLSPQPVTGVVASQGLPSAQPGQRIQLVVDRVDITNRRVFLRDS